MRLDQVTIDNTINIRDELDEDTVRRYMEIFDQLPAVTVFRLPDGTCLLAGGFHRAEAARRLGREEIRAEVQEGTRQEAEDFAALDNLTHGKPYSRTERRKMIESWLRRHTDWSNNRIAQALSVSDQTVRVVRDELEATSQIAKLDALVGADGKAHPRKMPERPAESTSQIGKLADAPEAEGNHSGTGGGGEQRFPPAEEYVTARLVTSSPSRMEFEDNGQITDGRTQTPSDELPIRTDGDSGATNSPLQTFPDIPAPDVTLTNALLAQSNAVRIPLPDKSVQTVAFSSPYWGLRQYDGDTQAFVWPGVTFRLPGGELSFPGGDGCDHQWANPAGGQTGDYCLKCGAWRGPLGLEPSPEMFVGHLTMILREVCRVLRDDGTCWLNLGFSYWGGKGQSGQGTFEFQQSRYEAGESISRPQAHVGGQGLTRPSDGSHPDYKSKDLVEIPWLVGIAARMDGWYLRSAINWVKDNAMPSSVDDRPTQDYELVLLLAKSDRYFYDIDALREPVAASTPDRYERGYVYAAKRQAMVERGFYHTGTDGKYNLCGSRELNPLGRNKRTTWYEGREPVRLAEELLAAGYTLEEALQTAGIPADTGKENSSDTWRVNTSPYTGAHYAAWPPALVARMIQAGSPPAVCARCGKPYVRVIERSLATHEAGDDPTMQTGRAGFNRERDEAQTRLMTVSQAEIAAFLKSQANGRTAECRERFGTKWDHWIRTDDTGARLPTPDDWLDLKSLLGFDSRYDKDILPYTGKQANYARLPLMGTDHRPSTQIRDEWEQTRRQALGWRPDCACFDHPLNVEEWPDETHPVCGRCGQSHTKPAIVLDVTAGSGTTVQVARQLGRIGIGLDISLPYLAAQAKNRVVKPAKVSQKQSEVINRGIRLELPENEVITGDLIQVLPHLPVGSVDLIFADPPFNIGKIYGSDRVDDRLGDEEYRGRLRLWLASCLPLLKPTGSLVIHHIPVWAYRAAAFLEDSGLYFQRWVAWQDQSTFIANRVFRPEHYVFLWFSREANPAQTPVYAPHQRCARCGDYATHWGGKEKFRDEQGKTASDVWSKEFTRIHAGRKSRAANELPLEAVLRWVLALTKPGDYVFDPFLGSGTTAAAAELSGRRWGGVEINPDNLGAIRAKQDTAREMAGAVGDVDAMPPEERAGVLSRLTAMWGEKLRVDED